MIPRRFSLLALLVMVSLFGTLFAYLERKTRQHVIQTRISTELVPAAEPEVSRQTHAWLVGLGFQPVSNPPLGVQGIDLFGNPYRNFYVGSYQGSPRFYVSVHPNWDPVDNPAGERSSNILIYVAAEFTTRVWQVPHENDRLDKFVDDFRTWTEQLR